MPVLPNGVEPLIKKHALVEYQAWEMLASLSVYPPSIPRSADLHSLGTDDPLELSRWVAKTDRCRQKR